MEKGEPARAEAPTLCTKLIALGAGLASQNLQPRDELPFCEATSGRIWQSGQARGIGERARLRKSRRVVKEKLTKKTEPEQAGSGTIRSAPLGSKVGEPGRRLTKC